MGGLAFNDPCEKWIEIYSLTVVETCRLFKQKIIILPLQ